MDTAANAYVGGVLTQPGARSLCFGPFELFPERQLLIRNETPVRIGGRALDLLTALAERPGELVTKRELMARAWPNIIVDEGNLKVNMASLRRALGDKHGVSDYIATVTGRGYRFVALVETRQSHDSEAGSALIISRTHNLPASTARIFGRKDAIETIRHDLSEARIVSIVGSGGAGKTTVALAVAAESVDAMPDGTWLVDFSILEDPSLVPNAVATAVGLSVRSADMQTAISEGLRDRKMLLLFDNCEHIIDAVAACAAHILAEAAGVKILATSREALRIRGERVRRLPGLDVPPLSQTMRAREIMTYPAIQLFVDRATDVGGLFELTDADATIIAGICGKLDGLALAIELAASRVHALSIDGLLAQLEDRLQMFVGRRDAPERHHTLIATIDWSYRLLTEAEQALLRRLSIFAGRFSLESARSLRAEAGAPQHRVIEDLTSLVAKSLVTTEVVAAKTEYRLLYTTRRYALEKLAAHDELEDTHHRHVGIVLDIVADAEADCARLSIPEWLARYSSHVGDIRNALRWTHANPGKAGLAVQLTVAAIPVWKKLSLVEECRAAVENALDARFAAHRTPRDDMTLLLTFGSTMLHTRGARLQVKSALTAALEIAEALENAEYQVECLKALSEYEIWTGDSRAALAISERIRSIATTESAPAGESADAQAGSALSWLGNLPASRRHLEKVVRLHSSHDRPTETVGFEVDQGLAALGALATVQWLQGFPDQAIETARRQREEAETSRDAISLCYSLLHGSAIIALYVRDYDAADRYLADGVEHAARHGLSFWRAQSASARYRWQLYMGQRIDLDGFRKTLAELREGQFRVRYQNNLTNYGEALARQGDVAAGLEAIDDAIALSEDSGHIVGIPEMLRIRGNVLHYNCSDRDDEARGCYLQSIERARRDGSLSWELRSAVSLLRLERAKGGDSEAEAMLAATYRQFTEGFSTGDLRRAHSLLHTAHIR